MKTKSANVKGHAERDEEGLLFWSTDIDYVYEKLGDLQDKYAGALKCVDVRKKYGSDMHSIVGLHIARHKLPKLSQRRACELRTTQSHVKDHRTLYEYESENLCV